MGRVRRRSLSTAARSAKCLTWAPQPTNSGPTTSSTARASRAPSANGGITCPAAPGSSPNATTALTSSCEPTSLMHLPMSKRLPAREGEWIDRNRPVEFRFEGVAFQGFEGDVLSSALWASGVRLLGRSFKYHRPRGVYSLANHDVNVLVEDGAHTNLRGDSLPIRPGLDVRAVNTAGGLAGDKLRFTEWFSAFLPVGFYYKAFHTPKRLFPFYERQMRKVAGLGRLDGAARHKGAAKEYATCDVLVVGAGPAGLAAAIAAAEQQGGRVVLVDEHPRPGGSLHWRHGRQRLAEMLDQAARWSNLEIRTGTT